MSTDQAIQAMYGARAALRAMRLSADAVADGAQDAALAVLEALAQGKRLTNPVAYGLRKALWKRTDQARKDARMETTRLSQ